MYRLWLNGLYGLYGPRCPLFSKRPINLISLSLSLWFSNDLLPNKHQTIAETNASLLSVINFGMYQNKILLNYSRIPRPIWWPFNSLAPREAIWQHRTWSTLVQVMACCLTAPSHYLNQCWFIISEVQCHSPLGSFTGDTSAINH